VPLTQFAQNTGYDWDGILATLAAFGYPSHKVGALEVVGDPLRPVFVFASEANSQSYTNAIDGVDRRFVMEVNPLQAQLNQRLMQSANGLQVGAFYRRRKQKLFTFLGPARFVTSQGTFYTFSF
jgi:hypothetical protein